MATIFRAAMIVAVCVLGAVGLSALALTAIFAPTGPATPMPTDDQMIAIAHAHRAELAELLRLQHDGPTVFAVNIAEGRFYVLDPRGGDMSIPKPSSAMANARWRKFASDLHALGATNIVYNTFAVRLTTWAGQSFHDEPLRGYEYRTRRPTPLVASTTNSDDAVYNRYKIVYRAIGGGWYIWYDTG